MKEIKKTIKKTVGLELSLMEFMECQDCFDSFEFYGGPDASLVFVEQEILDALTPEVIKILKDTKIKLMLSKEDS
jgi:hypothetical protein